MSGSVLYIINNIEWFWSHRLPLALAAKEAGYKVIVAAARVDEHEKSKLAAHGFTAENLPDADAIASPITVLKNILALRALIKKHQPDILHAITIKYAFLAGLAALGIKVKRVHTIAGLGYLFSGNAFKPALLRMLAALPLKVALSGAEIIFQNPDDRNILVGRGFVKNSRTHLIRGSGVDLGQFAVSPVPQEDRPLVLMATRLLHDKGVAVFVEAAKILEARGVHARFEIAGGEVTSNPLAITKAQMEAMIAGSPVTWLGKVSDMPALLRACALFVYPSWYREGIPKVLLEACASGRGIVTTNHPGCREAVTDGVNGRLVPVKDAEATARAIEDILADPEVLGAMGRASRTKAESEFDVQKIVRETLEVYKKAA